MAKKRVYRPSSTVRYRWKLFRIYGAFLPETLALEFVDTMAREWGVGFGEYHGPWTTLLKSGIIPPETPRMDLAKYKSALNYVIRKAKQGYSLAPGSADRVAILHHITTVIGLPPERAEAIVEFVAKQGAI
jgi:hypothetical protein